MLTKMLLRKLVSVAQGLTYVSSATSTGSTIVIPSDAAIGDLAILWDAAENDPFTPSVVTPSGWSELLNISSYYYIVAKTLVSRKKLLSGDPGSTITGMNGSVSNRKLMVILRPNKAIGLITRLEDTKQSIDTQPSDQVKATQTAPYVVIGGAYCDVAPAFSSAWADQELTNNNLLAGFKIFNSGPASVTINLGTYGTDNSLMSCSLTVT